MAQPNAPRRGGLFAAQLRFWRRKRGLSQLDFSIAADVSARHISFLETGRARPSEAMVLRLAQVLGLPLRDRNTLLLAAGFDPAYPEPEGIPPAITGAIRQTLTRMHPCPVLVMDRCYTVLETNLAAARLLAAIPGRADDPRPLNLLHALFDPQRARPLVRDWEAVASALLIRLHQRALLTDDAAIQALIEEAQTYPGVPADWREPDFAAGDDPVQRLGLTLPGVELSFTVTLTRFSESRTVALDELMIETFLPLDDATSQFCEQVLGAEG